MNLSFFAASPEKEYEFTLKLASEILSESSLDILKLSLAIRSFSPAVSAFQQVAFSFKFSHGHVWLLIKFFVCTFLIITNPYFESFRWALWNPAPPNATRFLTWTECSAAVSTTWRWWLRRPMRRQFISFLFRLLDLIDCELFLFRGRPVLFSSEIPFASSNISKIIIVYGRLGSASWKNLHDLAVKMASQGEANYVYRHFSKVRFPSNFFFWKFFPWYFKSHNLSPFLDGERW